MKTVITYNPVEEKKEFKKKQYYLSRQVANAINRTVKGKDVCPVCKGHQVAYAGIESISGTRERLNDRENICTTIAEYECEECHAKYNAEVMFAEPEKHFCDISFLRFCSRLLMVFGIVCLILCCFEKTRGFGSLGTVILAVGTLVNTLQWHTVKQHLPTCYQKEFEQKLKAALDKKYATNIKPINNKPKNTGNPNRPNVLLFGDEDFDNKSALKTSLQPEDNFSNLKFNED